MDTYRVSFGNGIDGLSTFEVAAQPGKSKLDAVRRVHRAYGHLARPDANGVTTTYRAALTGQSVAAETDVTVNDDGVTFESWLRAVDRALYRAVGVTHHDLSDAGYWDAWAACTSAAQMARDAIANDDLFGSLSIDL